MVLIEVRSTVGPLSFGAIGVTGSIEAAVDRRDRAIDPPPSGRIEIDVSGLRSGNRLYDAELLRRIDARALSRPRPSSCAECGRRGAGHPLPPRRAS